ncbi:MAG: tetratricopeptide repeat protein, partial [Candidatus Cloacimonadaceae bacterium]|nr:tetratricopeptide repeat protein [Candidatus Cloacimonadaceae bacterium]
MDTKRLDEIKEKLKESLEPQLRASLLLEIAAEAWKTSSYTEGKTFAEAALELGVNLADESIQARASHLIGTFYAYLDDYDAALDYYLRAQVLNHRIANAIWEAECFNSMGDIFIRLGNLPKA